MLSLIGILLAGYAIYLYSNREVTTVKTVVTDIGSDVGTIMAWTPKLTAVAVNEVKISWKESDALIAEAGESYAPSVKKAYKQGLKDADKYLEPITKNHKERLQALSSGSKSVLED